MKRLSVEQEKNLIKKALELGEHLGKGSSRVVFDLGDGTVLKVAVDEGGMNQNAYETNLYFEHAGTYLAKVLAYGKYTIVMEKVDDFDVWTAQEIIDATTEPQDSNFYQRNFEIDASVAFDLRDVYDFLCDIHGPSADNAQIGTVIRDGVMTAVAYDYGFDPMGGSNQMSDSLDEILNEVEYRYDHFLEFMLKEYF